MTEKQRERIIKFVYEYQTLDPEIIKRAVPDIEICTDDEIAQIIQDDYEQIGRMIEYYENYNYDLEHNYRKY